MKVAMQLFFEYMESMKMNNNARCLARRGDRCLFVSAGTLVAILLLVVELFSEQTTAEEPVKEPQGNATAPVVKKKTEVDLLLEKYFPDPTFQPIEKIVKNWTAVPKQAMPEKVMVKVSAAYSSEDNSKLISEAAGHHAVPIGLKDGTITLGHLKDPKLRVEVKLKDTDLKERVTKLYDDKKKEAMDKVLAKREANRSKAEAHIAKLKGQGKLPKTDEDNPTASVEEKSGGGADPSMNSYGSKFSGDYWPSPKNGKDTTEGQEMSMGPVCGIMLVLYGKREAIIISLWDKGPGALAGLKVGDVLMKVDGKSFTEYGKDPATGPAGAPAQLGMAMLEAQSSERPLVITVKRAGESMDISVNLPAAPAFSDSFPKDCKRSQAMSKAAAEYLLEQQNDSSGKWKANDYTNAWCGLALLSCGEKKYAGAIKKLARNMAQSYDLGSNPSEKVMIEGGNGKGQASNWHVCITGMFLAEYYLATGDKEVLTAIEHCCRSMDIRIHPDNGRFGHSRDRHHLPYEGKGLVIVNVHAHLMWALEANIDGVSSYDWGVWNISYKKAVETSLEGGAVGYNFAGRGGDQSVPRTGAMLTALSLSGKNKSHVRKMGGWLADNNDLFPNVHAMTFIGPIYGFMGLKNTSIRDYRKAMDKYQWMFSLVQPANYSHGVYYYSDRGNSGGDGYCKKRLVGNVMALIVLNSHRDDTLWMLGNREKNWSK